MKIYVVYDSEGNHMTALAESIAQRAAAVTAAEDSH